jgi:hypothetical protein
LVLSRICHAQENAKEKLDFPFQNNSYLNQKQPGKTPEIFAPGIISSSEATEYGIAFNRPGPHPLMSL